MTLLSKLGVGLLAAATLASCRYGDSADLFLTHRLTWFSYVAGEDLAVGCAPGTANRYRLVYNGIYGEQVRAYDVTTTAAGAWLEAQILTPAYVGEISLAPPYGPFAVLGPNRASRALSEAERDRLLQALLLSRALSPARPGMVLQSSDYYWAVASCRAGTFTFAAYVYPSAEYAALTFVEQIKALDPIATPFREPRHESGSVSPGASRPGESDNPEGRYYFVLVTGSDGRIRVR